MHHRKLLKSNDKTAQLCYFRDFNYINNTVPCANFCHFSSLFLKVFSLISQFPSGTFPYPAGQHSMSFIKNYVIQYYIQ